MLPILLLSNIGIERRLVAIKKLYSDFMVLFERLQQLEIQIPLDYLSTSFIELFFEKFKIKARHSTFEQITRGDSHCHWRHSNKFDLKLLYETTLYYFHCCCTCQQQFQVTSTKLDIIENIYHISMNGLFFSKVNMITKNILNVYMKLSTVEFHQLSSSLANYTIITICCIGG